MRRADHDLGPGVHVTRRSLLRVPIVATCGVLLVRALHAEEEAGPQRSAPAGAFDPLPWNDFAKNWQGLAQALVELPADRDESYAAQLAGLIARVPIDELPVLESPRGSGGLRAGPSFFLAPCVSVEFRMEPGAELPLHNHPPQVVVTLCVEGEVRYRHFEIEGEAPPCTEIGGSFHARETRAGILLSGRTTALTRRRDGLHGFVAGRDGARIVDFTVSTTEDINTFSYVELSQTPIDAERRVFEATWLGKKR